MKSRTKDPDPKSDKIIRTARRLFVEKGYFGVSIPEIVRESGVSTGAIYTRFQNKAALARAIHDRTLGDFQQVFSQRLSGDESVREVLRTFAGLVCEFTEDDPVMMEYMLFMKHAEFLVDTPPICLTEPFQLLQKHLRRGIAQGEIRVDDYIIAGLTFTGVVLRAAELRLAGVLTRPLPEICELLVENGWNAIKA